MSKISTYEDLEAEEKRLQALLYTHKESLKDNLQAIKKGLKPLSLAAATVGMAFGASKTINPLSRFALHFGIDVVMRRFLLRKAGWFAKVALPFMMKNYASHFLDQRHKAKLLKKIKSFFGKAGSKTDDIKDTVMEKFDDLKEGVKQSASNIV